MSITATLARSVEEMIDITLREVKEFEFKCNSLFLQCTDAELNLSDHGVDTEELAFELASDLVIKLHIRLKEQLTESAANKVIGKLITEIIENTIGADDE